jgi:plasmid stabilization system protein ParE
LKILWSPEAADDLEAAVEHLVDRSPVATRKLVAAFLTAVERLANEPVDGPEHVLITGETVRGWPPPPFRIYYQRTAEALLLVRIYHQKRRPIVR